MSKLRVTDCPNGIPGHENPYQPPLPDEFLEDTVQGYEESIRTHEKTINQLRDRVRELEGENERLKWQLCSNDRQPVPVSVPILVGGYVEGADID